MTPVSFLTGRNTVFIRRRLCSDGSSQYPRQWPRKRRRLNGPGQGTAITRRHDSPRPTRRAKPWSRQHADRRCCARDQSVPQRLQHRRASSSGEVKSGDYGFNPFCRLSSASILVPQSSRKTAKSLATYEGRWLRSTSVQRAFDTVQRRFDVFSTLFSGLSTPLNSRSTDFRPSSTAF